MKQIYKSCFLFENGNFIFVIYSYFIITI